MNLTGSVSAPSPLAIVCFAAAVAVAATPTVFAEAPRAADDARVLYKASELHIFADTFRTDVLRLWQEPSSGVSTARAEVVRRQIEKHFSTELLDRLLIDAFNTVAVKFLREIAAD